MENVTAKALEFLEKAEGGSAPVSEPAKAAEPADSGVEGESPAKTAEPASQPDVQTAVSPEAVDETVASNEKAAPGEEAPKPRVIKAVIGGQVREITEDVLISLANTGYSVETERASIAQTSKEIEALVKELTPYKEKLDAMKKAEAEEEDSDPFLRLQKKTNQLEEELKALRTEKARQENALKTQQSVSALNKRVSEEQKKHEVFSQVTDPAVQKKVAMNIYGAIAYGGKTPAQAVADEARDLKTLMGEVAVKKAQGAISAAKRPSTPGRGAPPVTSAKKMDRSALYNGDAYEAAMDLIRARESK